MKRNTRLLSVALVAIAPAAFAQGKACGLVTPEEIQAVVRAKPSLKASTLPNGVDVCTGKAGSSTVTIRLYERKDDAERDKEVDSLYALEKAGATIENRKFGSINCRELRPGGKVTRLAYTTTCTTPSTAKLPRYAVIEVSNPSTSLETRKLAPLADSIAGRIY